MSIIDNIIALGREVYEETGVVPTRLVLPQVAHDKLKTECARRMAQEPHVVPGTISRINIDTGHGVIEVLSANPEPLQRHGDAGPVTTSALPPGGGALRAYHDYGPKDDE